MNNSNIRSLTAEDIVHIEDELQIQVGWDKTKANAIKQQILDNQEIVQRLKERIKLYSDLQGEEAKYCTAILKDVMNGTNFKSILEKQEHKHNFSISDICSCGSRFDD